MDVVDSVVRPVKPIVGTLRVVGGTSLDAAARAAALPPPHRVARGREGEQLFILLNLVGSAPPHLYRELREVIAQMYWSTTGSITAALRQVAVAVNRRLFEFNLRASSSDRCYGGLACAVLHGDDFFIMLAGPIRACVVHDGRIECFPGGEELPHLGMGALARERLFHAFAALGDTLLLSSPSLIQGADDDAGNGVIARVLLRAQMQEVLAGLQQVGAGADFTALVARLAPSPAPMRAVTPQMQAPVIEQASQPPRRQSIVSRLRRESTLRPGTSGLDSTVEARPALREMPAREPETHPRPASPVRSKPARPPGPSLGERLESGLRAAGRGVVTAGGGIVAAGAALGRGVKTLVRRMLPGPEREARRRARPPRQVPKENRVVMMTIAIAIPILLAIVVGSAYYGPFGKDARFQSLIAQAEAEMRSARATSVISETRSHWQAALVYAGEAITERPGDDKAAGLQVQIQVALDEIDGVIRLTPVQLKELGVGTVPRQLIIHGQMVFVLDPAAGWVVKLTLNPAGDGVIEQDTLPRLAWTGQQVREEVVGNLVDLVWVEPGGDRQTGGLVILDENSMLVTYDPGWGGAEGQPELAPSFLGTSPTGVARAIGSFEGRFYILDIEDRQIWRYEPRGYVYPEQPDRYFAIAPGKSLVDALDMAIDGSIYILYADGTILKFLSGESQPFGVRGLPDGIGQAIALAVDSDSRSGTVYVAYRASADQDPLADRGSGRIVVLGDDGTFQAQLCAGRAFDALEAIAVSEATGRLYAFSGGRLYVAPLPAPLP